MCYVLNCPTGPISMGEIGHIEWVSGFMWEGRENMILELEGVE